MKGFKKLLILFLISALILGMGAVSAADDLGASEEIINTEVSADLNAIDDSQSIDDSNSDDIISVNEENENEEIQSGESASLGEDTDILKASGNTITVQGNTFNDIQNAIDSASVGDTISLSGTYYGNGEPITINNNISAVIGNGNTVLDAKGLSNIFLVYYSSEVIIKNLNFINGNVSADEEGSTHGGAIDWRGNNGILEDCCFSENSVYSDGDATASGGAVYWSGSNGIIRNCTFSENCGNGIYASGGAVYWRGYNGTILNCTFSDNSAISHIAYGWESSSRGGAIYWSGYNGTILNCTFSDNSVITDFSEVDDDYDSFECSAYGGAIYWSGGSSILENCTFSDNSVHANYAYGGVVYWSVDDGIIESCNFTNNNVDNGIINIGGRNNRINNCLFENNFADDYENAISIFDVVYGSSNCNLTGSSFINNSGCAISWEGSRGNITGCVFINNSDFYRPHDENDYLSNVYMDNGIYDFSMKIYGDVVLGDPKYYYGEEYYEEETPNWLIYLEHYGSKEGNLVVSLNGEEVYNEVMNHRNTLSLSDLQSIKYGSVNMAVKFVSDGTEVLLYEGTIEIDYDFKISGFYDGDSLIYYSSDPFTIYLPEDATGELSLYDGIKTYILSYANGESTFKLNASNYKIGNHTFSVSLKNDPIYPDKTITRIFYVIPEIYSPMYVAIGENEFITIESPEDFDGTIIIYNGTQEEVEIDYGEWTDYDYITIKDQEIARITDAKGLVKIPISDLPLKIGENRLVFRISGEGDYEQADLINVFENDPRFTSSIDSTILKLGDNLIVRVTAPRLNGGLEIYAVNENIYKQFSLSKTNFTEIISGLGLGEHEIKVVAGEYIPGVEDEDYDIIYSNTFYVNVTEEGQTTPELDATIELDYLDGNVVIKLKDLEGNSLSAKKVLVFINDVVSTFTTNGNGEVSVPITENSTIKAVYTDSNGFNVSSTLVVKIVESTVEVPYEVPVSANVTITMAYSDGVVRIVLKDLSGHALANKVADVSINGEEFVEYSTNEYGLITVDLTGNFSVKVVYADANGASVSASLINTVNDNTVIEYVTQDVPVSANATIEFVSEDGYVTVVLKDLDGNALADKIISLIVNGKDSRMITNAYGEANTNIMVNGNYTINAIYTDANGASVSASLINTVNDNVVEYVIQDVPVSANATINLATNDNGVKIVLNDLDGNPIVDGILSVTVNGISFGIPTNANGEANVSVSGNYSVKVVYADANGASVSASLVNTEYNKTVTPAVPSPVATSITASAITTVAKTNKNIVLTLYANGAILANKYVTVFINGKTTTVKTDANGKATIKTNFAAAGTYYYSLCFLGDKNYKASFKTVKVTVNKQATKAIFKSKTFKVKATKKISFTLKDASGKIIKSKKITFKVNKKTYTVKTNSKGIATVTIKITKKGKYTATAKFAGDSAYKAISKKATITVK